MAQDVSDVVSNIIQKTDKKIETLFERDDMFFTQIEKRPDITVSPVQNESGITRNRDLRIPLEIEPGGITRGWNPGGGSLGSGSAPKYQHATAPTVHLDHAVSWQEIVELATNSPEKAVANIVKRNLASAMKEFRRNIESLCMHTNRGYLAEIDSGTPTTGGAARVAVIDDDWGFVGRLVRPGMRLSHYDISGSAIISGTTGAGELIVDKVDGRNITFTNTGAWPTAVADGDFLFLAGLTGAPPNSIYGVQYHNDNSSSGTWMGIDRSDYPNVRAFGRDADGAFALAPARLCVNQIMIRAGMKKGMGMKLQAWMHPGQMAAYEALGNGTARFITNQGNKDGLNMFFGGDYMLAGARVVASPNWDRTRIDFIALDNWMRIEGGPIRWYGDNHGRRVFEERDSSGGVIASWISYLTANFNLFTRNPLCNAYVHGITVPAGY